MNREQFLLISPTPVVDVVWSDEHYSTLRHLFHLSVHPPCKQAIIYEKVDTESRSFIFWSLFTKAADKINFFQIYQEEN